MKTLKFNAVLMGTDDSHDTGVVAIPPFVLEQAGVAWDTYGLVRLAREARKGKMGLGGRDDFALTDEQWEYVCKIDEHNATEYLEEIKIIRVLPNGTETPTGQYSVLGGKMS